MRVKLAVILTLILLSFAPRLTIAQDIQPTCPTLDQMQSASGVSLSSTDDPCVSQLLVSDTRVEIICPAEFACALLEVDYATQLPLLVIQGGIDQTVFSYGGFIKYWPQVAQLSTICDWYASLATSNGAMTRLAYRQVEGWNDCPGVAVAPATPTISIERPVNWCSLEGYDFPASQCRSDKFTQVSPDHVRYQDKPTMQKIYDMWMCPSFHTPWYVEVTISSNGAFGESDCIIDFVVK